MTTRPNSQALALQASVINAITASVFQPAFSCPEPASECSWPDFSTLGICAVFENMTDIAHTNCPNDITSGNLNCTATFPGIVDPSSEKLEMTWDQNERTMLFQSFFYPHNGLPCFGTFTTVKAQNEYGRPAFTKGGLVPPPVEASYSKFSWCVRRYHNITASPGRLISTPPSTELLTFESTVEKGSLDDVLGTNYIVMRANSTGELYNISRTAYIEDYLGSLFNTIVWKEHRPSPLEPLSLGFALYDTDLANATHNLAEAMTNMIRSDTPGDNFNATSVYGEASFKETYINVRWPWMILPLAEVALAAILLTVSIAVTRLQPLLRASPIAYLAFGLRGWSDAELAISPPQTACKLEHLSEKMVARLDYDDQNQLRFMKTTPQ